MKRIYCAILAFLLMILTACGRNTEPLSATGSETSSDITQETKAELSENNSVEQEPFEPICWEDTHLEKGTLKYTVNNIWVANGISGLDENCFPEYDANATIFHPEWEESFLKDPVAYQDQFMTVYSPPELWDSTGAFVEGIRMVMLDVTVENSEATNQYLDNNGNLTSRYDDPYVFTATALGVILDIDRHMEKMPDAYWSYSISYFSELGKRPENPFAYRIEPGQSITFQVGYLLGNYPDGERADVSNLILSMSSTDRVLGSNWASLNLKENS